MFITVGLERVVQQQNFIGKDLAGNAVSKAVKGDGTTGVQTFSSIQGAIDAITTETGLRIRVAEDHVETGTVNVKKDDLRIEFWDIDGADAATEVTTFNLDDCKNLTLGGARDANNGNALDNKIVGTDGKNIIRGKDGNDQIVSKVVMISYTQERVTTLLMVVRDLIRFLAT